MCNGRPATRALYMAAAVRHEMEIAHNFYVLSNSEIVANERTRTNYTTDYLYFIVAPFQIAKHGRFAEGILKM